MTDYVFEGIEILKPSWLEIRLAIFFGKKTITIDSGYKVTAYHRRGKTYIASCERKAHQ